MLPGAGEAASPRIGCARHDVPFGRNVAVKLALGLSVIGLVGRLGLLSRR